MRKYKLVDLFCGAGGMSLGFCLTSRFHLLAGIDNNEWALRTLYSNHPESSDMFTRPQDICALSGRAILSALDVKRVDAVIGGPPCQGFSVAGRREASDTRNQLVWEYLRLVAELEAEVFVMENVPGLLLAKDEFDRKITDILLTRFEAMGYKCALWKLNAVDYGVPQVRKRTFIVGVNGGPAIPAPEPITRNELDLFNKSRAPVIVGEALSDLPSPIVLEPQPYNGGPYTQYQQYLREGSEALYNHTPSVHKPDMVERLRTQKRGTRLYSNWNHSWYKLDVDKPAPTVKENHRAPFVHPIEPRVTTPRECARLQSFPDSYRFCGTKTAQLMQIGNAVPPLLAKAIALTVISVLDEKRHAKAASLS